MLRVRATRSATTAVFYYLVVAETSTDDTAAAQILGYAYRPSSMVIFQKTVNAVSGGIDQPTRAVVEGTVVAHEFGHIVGLVNAGTAMQAPHEDSAHAKHDSNKACTMYHANNSSELVANLLSGGGHARLRRELPRRRRGAEALNLSVTSRCRDSLP